MRDNGRAIGSGFLLGDTGLLVTDSSILAGLGKGLVPPVTARIRPFADIQSETNRKADNGVQSYLARLVISPRQLWTMPFLRLKG